MQSKMGTFPCLCPSMSLPGGSAARLADLLWTVFIRASCLGAALPWEDHFTALKNNHLSHIYSWRYLTLYSAMQLLVFFWKQMWFNIYMLCVRKQSFSSPPFLEDALYLGICEFCQLLVLAANWCLLPGTGLVFAFVLQ